MDIFDIIGPVMVGPSSSHTAGAVRIGYISQKLMGEQIKEANILLYGSFLDTGKGHGTNKAIVAGLLGMQPDDMRIPHSMEIAEKKGIKETSYVTIYRKNINDYRRNRIFWKRSIKSFPKNRYWRNTYLFS